MTHSTYLVIVITTCLTACSTAPEVESSTPEECTASFKGVAAHAAEEGDSAAYSEAVTGLLGHGAQSMIAAAFSGMASAFDDAAPSVEAPIEDTARIWASLCQTLDGLTYDKIVGGADSLGSVFARQLEEDLARAHYQALLDAERAFESVQDSLRKFAVLSARVRQSQGFVGLESVIEMRVRNGTNHPISRAYFTIAVTSPNRSVPWIQDDFNYSIPGGLEPAEEATWRLEPNMFDAAWSSTRVPADAQTNIEVVKLVGPDGEPLWGGPDFTRGDRVLLDSLRTRFGNTQ